MNKPTPKISNHTEPSPLCIKMGTFESLTQINQTGEILIAIILQQQIRQSLQSMTDNFTERKSKELKERSQSVRNIKAQPKSIEYYGATSKMEGNALQSKPSKEYNKMEYDISNQKSNSKNLNDHSDYIKNLYKKYLGKENQIQSDKKTKPDPKPSKSIIAKDELKDTNKITTKLFYEQPVVIIKNSLTHESNSKKEYIQHHLTDSNQLLTRNKSAISIEYPKQKKKPKDDEATVHYKQMLSNDLLLSLGDPRNSLIRCMKNISQAKKSMKLR